MLTAYVKNSSRLPPFPPVKLGQLSVHPFHELAFANSRKRFNIIDRFILQSKIGEGILCHPRIRSWVEQCFAIEGLTPWSVEYGSP